MRLRNYFIFLIVCKLHIISSTRISDKKCEEYSKIFPSKENFKKREIPADNFFANFFDFPTPGKVSTEPGEFPHMARLGFNDINENPIYLCGGVLITDHFILTSATCTTTNIVFVHARRRRDTISSNEQEDVSLPPHAPLKWIQLGNNITGIQEFTPEQIILHPKYKNETLYQYNIALLKLNKKVDFTEHIRPACLYSSDEDLTNKTVIGTGWGRTSFDFSFSQELMKVDLEVFTKEECKNSYEVFESTFNENEMCVGHRDGSNTLCEGDGGAPLQIRNKNFKNMYDIVGIVSVFYTCNVFNYPVYAARIMAYIPWIENIVWTK